MHFLLTKLLLQSFFSIALPSTSFVAQTTTRNDDSPPPSNGGDDPIIHDVNDDINDVNDDDGDNMMIVPPEGEERSGVFVLPSLSSSSSVLTSDDPPKRNREEDRCDMKLARKRRSLKTEENIRKTFDTIDVDVSIIRTNFASRILSSRAPPLVIAQSLCEESIDMRDSLLDAIANLSSQEHQKFISEGANLDVPREIKHLETALRKAKAKEIRGVIAVILAIDRATEEFSRCSMGLNQKLADVVQIFADIKNNWLKGMTQDREDILELEKMDSLRSKGMEALLYMQKEIAHKYITEVFCPVVHETLIIFAAQFDKPLQMQCGRMEEHFQKIEALLAPLTDPNGKCWSYYLCGRGNCDSPTDPTTYQYSRNEVTVSTNMDEEFPVVLGDAVISRIILEHDVYYEPRSWMQNEDTYLWNMRRDVIAKQPVMEEMLDLLENVQKLASYDKTAPQHEQDIMFKSLAFAQGYVNYKGRVISDQDNWIGSFAQGGSCRIAGDHSALANVDQLREFRWMPVNETVVDPRVYNSSLEWSASILTTPTAVSSTFNLRNELNQAQLEKEVRKLSEEGFQQILANHNSTIKLQLEHAKAEEVADIASQILGIGHLLRQTNQLCNGNLLLQAWNRIKKGSKFAWNKVKKFFFSLGHKPKWSFLKQKLRESEKDRQREKIARRMIYEKTMQANRFGNEVFCPAMFETLKKELDKPVIDANKTKTMVAFLRDQVSSLESPASCMYYYWCGNSTCDKQAGLESYNAFTGFENSMGDLLYEAADNLQRQTDQQMNTTYNPDSEEDLPLVARWKNRARKWMFHRKNTTDWGNPEHFILKDSDDCAEADLAIEELRYKCFQPIVLGDRNLTLKLIENDSYLDPRILMFSDDWKRWRASLSTMRHFHIDMIDATSLISSLALVHGVYYAAMVCTPGGGGEKRHYYRPCSSWTRRFRAHSTSSRRIGGYHAWEDGHVVREGWCV